MKIKIINLIKSILGVKQPSKHFYNLGRNTIGGSVLGFYSRYLNKANAYLDKSIKPHFESFVDKSKFENDIEEFEELIEYNN